MIHSYVSSSLTLLLFTLVRLPFISAHRFRVPYSLSFSPFPSFEVCTHGPLTTEMRYICPDLPITTYSCFTIVMAAGRLQAPLPRARCTISLVLGRIEISPTQYTPSFDYDFFYS